MGAIPISSTVLFLIQLSMRRRRHNRPKPKIRPKDTLRINEQILATEVVVIDEAGENHGIMALDVAIAFALERDADLVEVSPLAKPPVCKITDYGKLVYQQAKKEQQAKAKQKKIDIKGIRIGFNTDTHDLAFKKAQAEGFMAKGHKIRVELVLHGREKALGDKAKENMNVFLKSLATPFKFEEEIKRAPKGFSALIAPE